MILDGSGVVRRPHISAGTGQELAPVVSEDDSNDEGGGGGKVPANKFSAILVRDVLVRYLWLSAPTLNCRRGASSKSRFGKLNFPSLGNLVILSHTSLALAGGVG